MALPRKLKNLNLFNDGENYLGVAKSVTPPKLGRKLEKYRGGGMNGPVHVDLGLSDDGLVLEFTLGGFDLKSVRQYAAGSVGAVPLRFAGAYQQDDTEQVVAVEIVARGRYEEIDFGEGKPGEDTEQKIKMPLSYYKLLVDGETEVEIDIPNFVENVGGKDVLAAQRKAIGM